MSEYLTDPRHHPKDTVKMMDGLTSAIPRFTILSTTKLQYFKMDLKEIGHFGLGAFSLG
jgi:hypothetical protein